MLCQHNSMSVATSTLNTPVDSSPCAVVANREVNDVVICVIDATVAWSKECYCHVHDSYCEFSVQSEWIFPKVPASFFMALTY